MAFLVIGIIGATFLLLSFLLDGIFEAFDFDILDNGILSTVSLAVFTSVFGFVGWIGVTLGWSMIANISIGFMGGAVAGIVIGVIMKYLRESSQADGAYSVETLVGKTARVTSGAGAGEYGTITVTFQGMNESLGAVSTRKLVVGQEVIIEAVLSHSSVKVS